MEESQIFPRLRDLYTRCVNKNIVTNTAFLTPREQAEALEAARRQWGCTPYFFGGCFGFASTTEPSLAKLRCCSRILSIFT